MYGPKLSTVHFSEILDGSYIYIPNARNKIDSEIESDFAKVIGNAFEDIRHGPPRLVPTVFLHFCGPNQFKEGRFVTNDGRFYDFRMSLDHLCDFDAEFIRYGFRSIPFSLTSKYEF